MLNYQIQPSARLYDILMREKVKKMSGTDPEDIVSKWTKKVSNTRAKSGRGIIIPQEAYFTGNIQAIEFI